MTTETKVEAVAWLVTSGDARVICMSEATADAQAFELRKGGYPASVEKLIQASAITALEGERDAAERRVAELEALLRAWYAEESRYGVRSQAPGHRHQVPGIWDSDTGPLAGTPCAKCALWKQIREIARSESP
jgi:hypothetical protein